MDKVYLTILLLLYVLTFWKVKTYNKRNIFVHIAHCQVEDSLDNVLGVDFWPSLQKE